MEKLKTIKNWELVILCGWIASFTICVDIIYEFKFYDFFALSGFFIFRNYFSLNIFHRDTISFSLYLFTIMSIIGTFTTFIYIDNISWMKVIYFRLFRLLSYVSIFYIIRQLNLNINQLRILLNTILFSIIAQAIIILLQYSGIVPILWSAYEMAYGIVYTGTLGLNHLNSVLFMSLGICLIIGKIGETKIIQSKFSIILYLFLPMITGAMLIAEARSSFIAIAAIIVSSIKRIKIFTYIVLIFIIGSFILSHTFGISIKTIAEKTYQRRIESKIKRANEFSQQAEIMGGYRYYTWQKVVKEMLENPQFLLLGAGFQNFKEYKVTSIAAHNQFLHVFGELGILGLIFYCTFFISLILRLINLTKKDFSEKSIPFSAISFTAMLLTVGFFNETFYPSRAVPGFMGIGLSYFAIVIHHGWFDIEQNIKPTKAQSIKKIKIRW